jgi:sugar/nucleoside kinase (ribokinase family)
VYGGNNMHQQKRQAVITAGHLCLDLSPLFSGSGSETLHDILVPGKLVNVGPAALSTGGAVSNTGLSLKMLGIQTHLMGKIGADPLGETIRAFLHQYHADDSLVVDPEGSSSYSIVIAPPNIDRIFLHHPGTNDTFTAQDIDLEAVAACRLFHFGYPPLMRLMYESGGDELARLFRLVRARGATTSLDLALPDPVSPAGQANWPMILGKVLPLTDIFVPSLEELLYMLDRPYFNQLRSSGDDIYDQYDFRRLSDLADHLMNLGIKVLVIKLGRWGLYVRTVDGASLHNMGPARPADLKNWSHREILSAPFHLDRIVSTSGAGDASIAGFLAGLLNGLCIEDSCDLACAVAGLKIQSESSVGQIPPFTQVLHLIPAWRKESQMLEQENWDYSDADRLWHSHRDRLG